MPAGVASVSVWFWSRGLDNLEPTCGRTTVFIFAPVDPFGRVPRGILLCFACINLAIWGVALSGICTARLFHITEVLALEFSPIPNRTCLGNGTAHAQTNARKSLLTRILTRIWEECCILMKETDVISVLDSYPDQFREYIRKIFLLKSRDQTPLSSQYRRMLSLLQHRAHKRDIGQRQRNRQLPSYFGLLDRILSFIEDVESGRLRRSLIQSLIDDLEGHGQSPPAERNPFGRLLGRPNFTGYLKFLFLPEPRENSFENPKETKFAETYRSVSFKPTRQEMSQTKRLTSFNLRYPTGNMHP
jgi:hypothetical protein